MSRPYGIIGVGRRLTSSPNHGTRASYGHESRDESEYDKSFDICYSMSLFDIPPDPVPLHDLDETRMIRQAQFARRVGNVPVVPL
jgi:hypothetical protein